MSRVKDIRLKLIPSKIANAFVRKHHYSGKVARTSKIHFGAFLDGCLHGVLSFGGSINKRGTVRLVSGTGWNDFAELNRMAFDSVLPKNSESRCLAISMKLFKKNAPKIKWIISFADATQCGDGTIYRASGFKLVGVVENKSLWRMPDGEVIASIVFGVKYGAETRNNLFLKYGYKRGKFPVKFLKGIGAHRLKGYQIKYIFFLHPKEIENLTVPILPFSKIDEIGARMYKGKRLTSKDGVALSDQDKEGGSNPTVRL